MEKQALCVKTVYNLSGERIGMEIVYEAGACVICYYDGMVRVLNDGTLTIKEHKSTNMKADATD